MNSKETHFEKEVEKEVIELSVKLANITKSLANNPSVGIAALSIAAGGLIAEQFSAINIKEVTALMGQLFVKAAIGGYTEPLTQTQKVP